jgi:hypothetical protein
VGLSEELDRAARAAAAFAMPDEEVALVLAAEPTRGERLYVCAYEAPGERRSWLALDVDGRPVRSRNRVREAVSIAALCEVAEERAGGGDLGELRARLLSLRLTENPPGVDDAAEAALELERAVGSAPRVATTEFLDSVGAASLRLELALGAEVESPFASAMRAATATVDELTTEVERAYKAELE